MLKFISERTDLIECYIDILSHNFLFVEFYLTLFEQNVNKNIFLYLVKKVF